MSLDCVLACLATLGHMLATFNLATCVVRYMYPSLARPLRNADWPTDSLTNVKVQKGPFVKKAVSLW